MTSLMFPPYTKVAFSEAIVIVIVISKFLKRYSKAKRTRAPAYSRALRRIKGGFPKGVKEKLRSEFQSTRRVHQTLDVFMISTGLINYIVSNNTPLDYTAINYLIT